MTDDARQALVAAAWPGNVRQLANVLERSAILAEGDEITADDLGLLLALLPEAESAVDPAVAASSTLSQWERAAIASALAATGGNRRLAAARLGMGLRTLYEKLKRYDL